MARLIKFRGLSIIHKKWFYGDLMLLANRKLINYIDNGVRKVVEIYSKTVGQFIGLYDKNGREIYEGDIINWTTPLGSKLIVKGIVTYDNRSCGYGIKIAKDHIATFNLITSGDLEVVGNIHETKEDN